MEDVTGPTYMTWEELDDCGVIDSRLHKMDSEASRCHSQSCQSIGDVITSVQSPHRETNKLSTSVMPQVRILKRQPNSDPCLAASNARATSSRPIRTLEEREAAYAEARLRILGSAAATESPTPSAGQAQPSAVNHLKNLPPQLINPETQKYTINGVKR